MDTQNRTSREEDLDKIIESMYTPVTEGKSHNCATHVEHSKWGKGECVSESHAEPDENGNVAWYNVIFEHGTEKVNTDDVKVVKSSHHMHASHKPKKKKKVNETDDWASRRIDHSANPRKRVTISPGAGEAYLKRKQAEREAEGWTQRCPHECHPDRKGTFRHQDGEICPECKGRGFVAPDHISPGARPGDDPKNVDIPGDASRDKTGYGLYASVKTSGQIAEADNDNDDSDIDHHNQYMMDQDLLQPIHQAASIATDGEAKNFNEWLILQIKDQGDNWIDWFIETVIVEERFKD